METNPKTSADVKAGLEIAAKTNPVEKEQDPNNDSEVIDTSKEQDPDELVHAQADELPAEDKEKDVDDLLHSGRFEGRFTPNEDVGEKDSDDLVHGK